MVRHPPRLALMLLASALLLAAPLTAAAAGTPTGLACTASVSDAAPYQHHSVKVHVRTTPRVGVRATARFKSGPLVRSTAANAMGAATVTYKVGAAKRGYAVRVTVRVTQRGLHAYCYTTFTPR